MKIYMDPMPKTCSVCPLGRKTTQENLPWYTCFVTGRTHTSITTERPEDCPAQNEEISGLNDPELLSNGIE